MANGIDYKKLYENNHKNKVDNISRQVANAKVRLAASGIDVEKATDNRNWFEKLTNLPQNQNAFFDLFELLDRPRNAVMSAIGNVQTGEGTALEGLKEGISGKQQTGFKKLLQNAAGSDLGDREGKVDLVDIAGIVGDVALDPIDIPFIKSGDKLISISEGVGKLGKGAVKKTANFADNIIEKGLTKIDDAKGIKYANKNAKWASELNPSNYGGLLEKYKGVKNNLTTMFDTKLSKKARTISKVNEAKADIAKRSLESKAKSLSDNITNTSKALGKTFKEVDSDLNKILDVTNRLTMKKVIDGATDGTVKYTDEIKEALVDIAKDLPDNESVLVNGISKTKDGRLVLSEDWSKNLSKFAEDKLQNTVERGSFYSKSQLNEINKLKSYYEKNAPELLNEAKNFYNDANNLLGESFSSMGNLNKKYADNNIEGFSKHKLSENYEKNLKRLINEFGGDEKEILKQFPGYQGSGFSSGSRTLNSRKYEMSAGEANLLKKEELKKLVSTKEAKDFIDKEINLFEDLYTSGIEEYINQMPKIAKNTQVIDEVLLTQGFGDLAQMSELKKAISDGVNVEANTKKLNDLLDNSPFRIVENGKAPYGFKKLDTDTKEYVVNFLKSMSNKTDSKELKKIAKSLNKLDNIAIDPTVLNILKISTDNTKSSEFLKMYDGLMNFYKGNKTASVTNQMNNIGGNFVNMYLSGMNTKDMTKYITKSISDLNKYDDLLARGAVDIGSLTQKERKVYENLVNFQKEVTLLDESAILKKYDIEDLANKVKNKTKNPYNMIVSGFASLNAKEDRVFKYAMYLKGLDDPKFLKNLGVSTAGEAVNKALVDYTDLTYFETNTMRRLVPFYTFAKKNLMFQFDNMGNNLKRYRNLIKTYNGITNTVLGDNYDNIQDYLKDNMYIPVPTLDENGNYKFMRMNLNLGDISDLTSDPLGSIVNKASPVIKLPVELVANKNLFTGREIEKYPGQKGNIDILDNIPVLNKAKNQQILSDLTGLDTAIKQLDRVYTGAKENGFKGATGNLFTIQSNVDTDRLNREYEQLTDLKNLISKYKDEGTEISTITELRQANKNDKISGLETIFNKYGVSLTNQK